MMQDERIDIRNLRVKLTRTGWGKFTVPIPPELPSGKALRLNVDAPAGIATWTLDVGPGAQGPEHQNIRCKPPGSESHGHLAPKQNPASGGPRGTGGPRMWVLFRCMRCGSKFTEPLPAPDPEDSGIHLCAELQTAEGPVRYWGVGELQGINEDTRA